MIPKVRRQTAAEERTAYETVTVRDGGRCVRCGTFGVVHRDHRQNRMRGNTVPENLQLLCPHDHQWKTEHPREATDRGFACPRWARPELWPARRWDTTGWVLYTGNTWEPITDSTADMLMNGGAR